MISEYLKTLKTQENLTNQQIADMSGVSVATVQRMVNEKGESTFETVVKVVRGLGGSLDALAGITQPESEETRLLRSENEALRAEIRVLRSESAAKDKAVDAMSGRLEDKDRATAYLKKGIRYLGTALAIIGFVFLFVVVFDILHGGIGYIRYDELSNQAREGMNVLLSALPDWIGLR